MLSLKRDQDEETKGILLSWDTWVRGIFFLNTRENKTAYYKFVI